MTTEPDRVGIYRVDGFEIRFIAGQTERANLVSGWDDVFMPVARSRLDRITVNPEVGLGKPTIRGMRIRVQDVLELLASGMSYEEIIADYDELERDDILAVLEFAALDSAARIQRFVA